MDLIQTKVLCIEQFIEILKVKTQNFEKKVV